MPIFEYTCNECRAPFEILHKGAENHDLIECPQCHARAATKKFSSFSATVSTGGSGSGSCESGSCDVPSYGGCAGGMCGLQ